LMCQWGIWKQMRVGYWVTLDLGHLTFESRKDLKVEIILPPLAVFLTGTEGAKLCVCVEF
jgi:hypothetical protein